MYSTEYTAVIVLFISTILNAFGYDVIQGSADDTVELVASALAVIWLLVKRFERGGINALGIRKK